MRQEPDKEKRKTRRQVRRSNAKLYPIYKMFSWDLLFFYAIEFLFYTITKKITAPQVLIVNASYLIFKIIMQIPAVTISEAIGKKRCMILGNIFVAIYIILIIFLPGLPGLIIATIFQALGYDMKTISESNLLYDSVATHGGEGLYSKLDAKGGSMYYIFDGITSLIAGYLFIINNYLPMVVCLASIVISIIIACHFEDVYQPKKRNISIKKQLKETKHDLGASFKYIFKSERMKALFMFMIVFYGFIKVIETYRSELLVSSGVSEENYAIIFAMLTFIAGLALTCKEKIEKTFKNRTLTFLSLTYIGACVIVGLVASTVPNNKIVVPIVILMYMAMKMCTSVWYILEYKYLKNFTNHKNREKITFTYEFVAAISGSILALIGSLILEKVKVQHAYLIVSTVALASMLMVLKYMKTRIGLKPEEYKKEDIEFEITEEKEQKNQ